MLVGVNASCVGLMCAMSLYITVQVYMSRDGLARFCTVPYEHPTNKNIHSAFMHLTNYSLNKKSRNYIHTESEVLYARKSVS